MTDPFETAIAAAAGVLERYRAAGLRLATAESCTGGLIAACLTATGGSSAVFDCGFVTYANEAKQAMLGVSPALLEGHGAVSDAVAAAMATGALARSRADIAVAVTGIAGPGGGSADKPVGLVCFGLARTGRPVRHQRRIFGGDRSAIRFATVIEALALLDSAL